MTCKRGGPRTTKFDVQTPAFEAGRILVVAFGAPGMVEHAHALAHLQDTRPFDFASYSSAA